MNPRLARCGFCERCGRVMVLIKLQSGPITSEQADRLGWECLICGRVMDLRGVLRRRGARAREGTPQVPLTGALGRLALVSHE